MVDIKSIFSKYTDYSLNKDYIITISIKDQKLSLFKNYEEIQNYKISTSKYGEGSEKDSNKTPLGSHYIKEQIGSNADIFTIFKNRMPTREITKVIKDQVTTEEDIISTRILWLSGLEEGKNKGLNIIYRDISFEDKALIDSSLKEIRSVKDSFFKNILSPPKTIKIII